VSGIWLPEGISGVPLDDGETGADTAWQRMRGLAKNSGMPVIRLANVPGGDLYVHGANFTFISGGAAGLTIPLDGIDGDLITVGEGFGIPNMMEMLGKVRAGDKVKLDNSNYIAAQTYHRHQLPDDSYDGFRQYRDENGEPLYPQRPMLIGPIISLGGCGSVQSGKYNSKAIVCASLMDESALPWQPDWYRRRVKEANGGDESGVFRLWFTENALHHDGERTADDLHTVSYLGALHQALLSVADWVERDVVPPESTVYIIKDGQLSVPETAAQRKGVQPTVKLTVNGGDCVRVNVGESVRFVASAQVPPGCGRLLSIEWSVDGDQNYPIKGSFANLGDDGTSGEAELSHTYQTPGDYFAVVRVQSGLRSDDPFVRIANLCRVRVVVG
jgi:hypothetical protein